AYAVAAFEAQAVDYVLKPVQPERLARTVQRVQQVLAQRTPASTVDEPTLQRLRALLGGADATAGATPARLQVIPASVGQGIRMVPVGEVLIRTPLKELMPQLDPAVFWQIHRGTVVRADAIDSVTRNEAGRLSLRLRGRPEAWAVSRLYAERFRAM
ncbi:MAG: LytR/AlgR family response regulator transcription factor, partial [Hydrogenophaga sp.]|uniref:LytR/AlgR family response regulator transcription factor n=1 Tax=Hydrogenophaga sp. TaxID=1904254 RepID=UPI004036923E